MKVARTVLQLWTVAWLGRPPLVGASGPERVLVHACGRRIN